MVQGACRSQWCMRVQCRNLFMFRELCVVCTRPSISIALSRFGCTIMFITHYLHGIMQSKSHGIMQTKSWKCPCCQKACGYLYEQLEILCIDIEPLHSILCTVTVYKHMFANTFGSYLCFSLCSIKPLHMVVSAP